MSSAFVVEVRGRNVGLLVRTDVGLRFLASLPDVYDLDDTVFPDKRAARAAIEARFNARQAGYIAAYAAVNAPRTGDALRLAT